MLPGSCLIGLLFAVRVPSSSRRDEEKWASSGWARRGRRRLRYEVGFEGSHLKNLRSNPHGCELASVQRCRPRRMFRTSSPGADVGGAWQLARRRTCWGVGFLDGNSYGLPSRGQDNESKREVRIPCRRCGREPNPPCRVAKASTNRSCGHGGRPGRAWNTVEEHSAPKSIVLGGRGGRGAPGSEMLLGVL